MTRAYRFVSAARPALTSPGAEVAKPLKVYWNRRGRLFCGKYKATDGRWKSKSIPVDQDTMEKARTWFARWLSQLSDTGVPPVNHEVRLDQRPTIRNLAPRWLSWRKQKHDADSKAYKSDVRLLKMWVEPYPIADVDLERELDLGVCTAWIESVKRSGRAAYTVRNIAQGLRGFLVDARGLGWIRMPQNPMLDPWIRKLLAGADTVAGKNVIVYVTQDQVVQLLTCDSKDIPNVRRVRNLLAISTGARLGELAAWTWGDIALDAALPTVKIFRQVQLESGKQRGVPIFKDPKKRSHRIVPLHPLAVRALRWWWATGWREHIGRAPLPQDPVFPTLTGGYTTNGYATKFREDLAKAGIPVLFDGKHPITFHAARRTFMTLLEGKGVPREVIGALAGHASRGVADRHYIAKNIARFAEAVSLLPLGDVVTLLSLEGGGSIAA